MKPRVTRWLSMLALVLMTTTTMAWAQAVTTSSMRGMVTDADGAVLPGATVQAEHVPSGSRYGTITNDDGRYNIRNMRVGGPYTVTISFVGFRTVTFDGIYLSLGDTYVRDATMSLQAVELGEVQVVAQGGIFDNERTGVGTNIGEDRISATPTIGRDIADFVRLTPQAYVENDDDDGPAISIAGQNNRFNSIYIDGTVNNDVFGLSAQGTNGGQTGSTPISIDAIEEFQINLSPFDVTQSGFTGGAINVVTRSGTNRFEGSVYGLLRNENLVGKTNGVEADFEGNEREALPEFTNNRYGFRLGGPIIRNKLFFFVNGEILRREDPLPFSSDIYGGDSPGLLPTIRQTLTDEVGYDPGDFGSKASALDDDKLLLKLNWNISQNHKLSARHSYSNASNLDAFSSNSRNINYANNSEAFPSKTNSSALELNSILGTNFANKLIIGLTTVRDDRGIEGNPFPSVDINDGGGSISLGSEPFSTANVLNQDIFTVTNNFNWFRGRHTLTIGANLEFYDIENLFIPRNFGSYEYDTVADFLQSVCAAGNGSSAYCQANYNGQGPAAPDVFQRGFSLVDGVTGDGTNAIGAFKAFQVGLYVQDEFQVNDDFNLTFGVRVDVPKVTTEPNFAPDVFTTTIPAVSALHDLNGAEPGKTPAAAPYFSPRLGFNYDVNGDRTLQVRGGVGVFTGRVPFVWPGSMFLNNGTNSGFLFVGGGTLPNGDPIPLVPDPNNALDVSDFGRSPDELIPSGRLEIFEEDFRYPRVLRTSLGVDAQLPYGIVGTLEGQYTNTLSGILVTNVNLNPNAIRQSSGPGARAIYAGSNIEIDDRYSAIHRVGNTGEGYTYDVTASLAKQFNDLIGDDGDLALTLAYTYGDAFVVNDGTSSQINTMWRSMEIGANGPNDLDVTRSDFSIGHRVLASVSVRKEFLNNLGTTVSLFYTGESGRPYNYTIDNFDDFVNAPGYRDFGLLYVPNDANELTWVSDPAGSAAALNRFIESSDYLSERRGQFAERNGSRLPFENIVDLKLSQELFANIGGRRQTLELTLDIFNFGNLINKDWGLRYGKFTSSSNGGFELIEFRGFVDEAGGDFTPTYRLEFDPTETPTEDEFFKSQIIGEGTYSSRWYMQLGVRYTF